MIHTIARYSLREAVQNRLLGLVAVLLVATFLLAEFVGAVALTEHAAIQAALAAGVLRVGAVLVMALFVVTTLLREQQDGTLEQVLALPQPRTHYVLGKLIAYGALSLALAAPPAALALLYADAGAVLRWGLSLACELWLVGGLGLLLAISFRQAVVAIAALGAVYVLARAMDALLLMLHQPVFTREGPLQPLVDGFMGLLARLLPSLHRFTDAGWLAYGTGAWPDLGVVAVQTLVYLVLLAAAAAFDLSRREL